MKPVTWPMVVVNQTSGVWLMLQGDVKDLIEPSGHANL